MNEFDTNTHGEGSELKTMKRRLFAVSPSLLDDVELIQRELKPQYIERKDCATCALNRIVRRLLLAEEGGA